MSSVAPIEIESPVVTVVRLVMDVVSPLVARVTSVAVSGCPCEVSGGYYEPTGGHCELSGGCC